MDNFDRKEFFKKSVLLSGASFLGLKAKHQFLERMDINISNSFDLSDIKIQEFLYGNHTKYKIPPADFTGYINEKKNRRGNSSSSYQSHFEEVIYLVNEEWLLERSEQGSIVPAGINNITVAFSQRVKIDLEFWLYLKNGISTEAKSEAERLFNLYDPDKDGFNIQQWVIENKDSVLDEDMFIIDNTVLLEKAGSKVEHNIEQRRALFSLYGIRQGDTNATIDITGDDYTTDNWGRDESVNLRKIGEDLIKGDLEPGESREIREVEPGQSRSKLPSILDDIMANVVNSDCGPMSKKNHKLMTVFAWPEFRIDWRKKRIKVGCSSITIVYPVLQFRISELVLFVYYFYPNDVRRTVLKIIETCAIRSALAGGVVGVVVGNPGAAISTFNALFKRCIEREVKECINPGIVTIKERGNWQ